MLETIVAQLEALLGTESVLGWTDLESPLQAALRNVADRSQLATVVFPNTIEQLAEVVTWAAGERHALLPLGSGSKLGWGGTIPTSPATNAIIGVCLARLDRLVEHAVGDLTLTAEAGIPIAALKKTLLPIHQQLGIDPAFSDRATLGGVVATGDQGSLRQGYGSIRDRILGVTFVRSDGQVVRAGGRVVKNVAGYDLMKLVSGAYGTLGIVAQMTVRLYPLPETSKTLIVPGDLEPLTAIVRRMRASSLSPAKFDWISPACVDAVLNESTHSAAIALQFANIPASVEQQVELVTAFAKEEGLHAISINDETAVWQGLQTVLGRHQAIQSDETVGCKFGLVPAKSASVLNALEPSVFAQIHAGSGIGWVHFATLPSDDILLSLRDLCQQQCGYFTVLQAPKSLKNRLDIWGYAEESLGLMRAIAHKFDPNRLFLPERLLPSR
ncbi:MAG: FAD-binding oxidoreductase [Cyanobacteria bacterium P01_E01_bin.34]